MLYKSDGSISKSYVKRSVYLLYYTTGIPTRFINKHETLEYQLGFSEIASPLSDYTHFNIETIYTEVLTASLVNNAYTHINQLDERYFIYVFKNNKKIQGMIAMGPVRIANDTSENQLAFMTKQDLSINEYTAYNKYKEQLSIVSPIQIQYYNHLLHISTHHTFDLSTAPILVEPRSEISSIPVLQPERFHHSYALEKQLGQNLFTDNIQVLEDIAEIFSAYPKPILAHNNPLRSEKNFFISTVNVYARFAIEAGLSAKTAFSYCDYFIQEVEVLSNIGNVEQLTFRMISTYKNLVKEHKNATFSNPVSLSMDYIDKHITDNITLSDVARTIGYSSKYLSEVFAKETDTTFKSYVMDKKLEVAKSLLLNPKNSILDICDYLGFCNQSYFSKMFKKNTGSSPSAFIKHHR